jgi:hypothetical protein
MNAEPLIADRGEFIDALTLLDKGRVMVRGAQPDSACLLDGGTVYTAHLPLFRFELVEEFDNPQGFAHLHYYRLSARGRAFARAARAQWKRTPLLRRLAVRFMG